MSKRLRLLTASLGITGLVTVGLGLSPLLGNRPVVPVSHPALSPSLFASPPASPQALVAKVYPERNTQIRAASALAPAPASPIRVQIPTLGVDANIVPAGYPTDPSGSGVPLNVHTVGWWGGKVGSRVGTIVLSGHVNSRTQGLGAFAFLDRLYKDQTVVLVTSGNRKVIYRVEGVAQYLKTSFPEKAILDQSVSNRLVLVTCGGSFDHRTGHYKYNIVIFAAPVA